MFQIIRQKMLWGCNECYYGVAVVSKIYAVVFIAHLRMRTNCPELKNIGLAGKAYYKHTASITCRDPETKT